MNVTFCKKFITNPKEIEYLFYKNRTDNNHSYSSCTEYDTDINIIFNKNDLNVNLLEMYSMSDEQNGRYSYRAPEYVTIKDIDIIRYVNANSLFFNKNLSNIKITLSYLTNYTRDYYTNKYAKFYYENEVFDNLLEHLKKLDDDSKFKHLNKIIEREKAEAADNEIGCFELSHQGSRKITFTCCKTVKFRTIPIVDIEQNDFIEIFNKIKLEDWCHFGGFWIRKDILKTTEIEPDQNYSAQIILKYHNKKVTSFYDPDHEYAEQYFATLYEVSDDKDEIDGKKAVFLLKGGM